MGDFRVMCPNRCPAFPLYSSDCLCFRFLLLVAGEGLDGRPSGYEPESLPCLSALFVRLPMLS
ncbi:MAG: hypothetical protein ACI4QU_04535, partial [Christensenellales bacterium]